MPLALPDVELSAAHGASACAGDDGMRALRLLHADETLVAIDKPAGLLVHRSALDAHATRTVVDLLHAQLGTRALPLHRLDRATSGVMLLARDPAAARDLRASFEAGRVHKRYVALVRGWPPVCGVIDRPLARDPERASTGQPLLPALTRFRRLARFDWPFVVDGRFPSSRYALLELEPATGRRHQLRRHLKQIAHPIVGDTTHGKGAHNRAAARWLGTRRLWLHAVSIALPHAGATLRIDAPAGLEWDLPAPLHDTVAH